MKKKESKIYKKEIVLQSINLDTEILEYLNWEMRTSGERNLSGLVRSIIRQKMLRTPEFKKYLKEKGIKFVL